MPEKTTPTEAELMEVIREAWRVGVLKRDGSTPMRIARAVLAKWGQPDQAADSTRSDALCDLSYCTGLKAGWNFCAADDEAGFEQAQSRATEALRILKAARTAVEDK